MVIFSLSSVIFHFGLNDASSSDFKVNLNLTRRGRRSQLFRSYFSVFAFLADPISRVILPEGGPAAGARDQRRIDYGVAEAQALITGLDPGDAVLHDALAGRPFLELGLAPGVALPALPFPSLSADFPVPVSLKVLRRFVTAHDSFPSIPSG